MKIFIVGLCALLSVTAYAQDSDKPTEEEKEVKVKIIVEEGDNVKVEQDGKAVEVEKKVESATEATDAKKVILERDGMKVTEMTTTEETNFPEFNMPSYEVTEESKGMSLGANSGQSMYIPDATPEVVAQYWQENIREYKANRKLGKSRIDKLRDGEVKAEEMMIPVMSTGLVNVYATFVESGSGVQMTTFYEEVEGGEFVTHDENQSAYTAAERMLQSFGKHCTRQLIEEELKMEEKNLKKIDGEQQKLIRDNGQYHKSIERSEIAIEKAQAAIEQAKADIEQNLIDQENKIAQADAQKKLIEWVKSKLGQF